MPAKGPKAASTRRQLATVRNVLGRLGLKFEEKYDPEAETNYFAVDLRGPDVLAEVHLVHEPGLVALYGVFGVKAPRTRRAELLAFANLFNAAFHQGTLTVRKDGRLVYRAACSYRKVKDLDQGYVASLFADMLDVVDLIDLPLILVAKGKTAAAAIKATWTGYTEQPFTH
ncbi:MAG: hypothetical protein AMXMBFR56_67350 [Polyangiaceae bacterium]